MSAHEADEPLHPSRRTWTRVALSVVAFAAPIAVLGGVVALGSANGGHVTNTVGDPADSNPEKGSTPRVEPTDQMDVALLDEPMFMAGGTKRFVPVVDLPSDIVSADSARRAVDSEGNIVPFEDPDGSSPKVELARYTDDVMADVDVQRGTVERVSTDRLVWLVYFDNLEESDLGSSSPYGPTWEAAPADALDQTPSDAHRYVAVHIVDALTGRSIAIVTGAVDQG